LHGAVSFEHQPKMIAIGRRDNVCQADRRICSTSGPSMESSIYAYR
jgi:hypothetical protein